MLDNNSSKYPDYTPKTVMITGATSDFGKAFAARFAASGARLILCGRNKDKLTDLASSLEGTEIYISVFDMSRRSEIEKAFAEIPEDFSNIDLLINNAGGALGLDPAYSADLDDWEAMIDVNNKALVIISRLVLAGMATRKSGHIINIGSIAGNWVYPGGNVYNACKAFTKYFSLALRADLTGTNIRVTNIEPGMVETSFSLKRFKGDQEKAEAVYANTKPLTADDIAESVYWSACLPPHVNINTMEIMPTVQSFGPLSVERF